jgi:hypothetical protein
MTRVVRLRSGWSVNLADRPGVRVLRVLPGDTPELARALHTLNRAGLLEPNRLARDFRPRGLCPRCGRQTAISEPYQIPSVCTACRAGWLAGRLHREPAPTDPDGPLVCDVWTAGQAVRRANGKTRRTKPCPEPARYPDGVYCAKHAKKMTRNRP